jgi:hypothetical protein
MLYVNDVVYINLCQPKMKGVGESQTVYIKVEANAEKDKKVNMTVAQTVQIFISAVACSSPATDTMTTESPF